jgi:hypothetical protein
MSKSRRAGAKARKRRDTRLRPEVPPSLPPEPPASRIGAARRRARAAKIGLGAAALVGLGAAMGLSRVSYAGHSKRSIETLAIPQPLYEVVRRNLLQSGILAPATAPPDATTVTS